MPAGTAHFIPGRTMKEPVILMPADRLDYSQEVLLYREPKELSLTVWIIASLFAVVLCWIVFGKAEEIVRAKGLVRPLSNISQVKMRFRAKLPDCTTGLPSGWKKMRCF